MYDQVEQHHSYDHDQDGYAATPGFASGSETASAEQTPGLAQVIWVAPQDGEAQREADPFDVINFLLKKVDDQNARISEHEGFAELQNQEIEQFKLALEAKHHELEITQADYDVVLQNGLATERELESSRATVLALTAELEAFRTRALERPRIQLPFHTEQKLAKLGYADGAPVPVEA